MTDPKRLWDDEVETLKSVLSQRLPLVPDGDLTATAIACARAVRSAFTELSKPCQG
jgi:hypothetical protein